MNLIIEIGGTKINFFVTYLNLLIFIIEGKDLKND